jgi:ribonuclease D
MSSLFDIATKLKQKAVVLEKNPEKAVFYGALVEDYEALMASLGVQGWTAASAALAAAQPVLGGRRKLRLDSVTEGDPVSLSRAFGSVPDVCRSLDGVYDALDAAFDAATKPGGQGTVTLDEAVAQGAVAESAGGVDRSRGPPPLSDLTAEEVARLMDNGAPELEQPVPSMFSRSSKLPRPQAYFATPVQNANVVRVYRREGGGQESTGKSAMGSRTGSTSDLPSMLASHIVASLRVPLDEADVRNSFSTHPYAQELDALDKLWASEPDRWLAPPATVRPVVPLADTALRFVTTRDELRVLVEDLTRATEFAIDLEHNAFRSYVGLVCLMQVSVEGTDYLVDTLALRDDLAPLQPAFASPEKVKIMHGADSDVLWLQENFGLFLVNVFDTGQAARVLEKRSAKLSSLLTEYCGVEADKTYQTADWRLRPLPPIMLHYAREDTHYLFHLYDVLRVDLAEAGGAERERGGGGGGESEVNLIGEVRRRSRRVTARVAEAPITHSASARLHASRLGARALFTPRSAAAYSAVFYWRDAVARQQDESPSYIASNDFLVAVAMATPSDVPGLLRAAGRAASPHLRSRASELVDILKRVLSLVPEEEEEEREGEGEGEEERGRERERVSHVAESWCLPCPPSQMIPPTIPLSLRPIRVRAVEDARGDLYMVPLGVVERESGRWLVEGEREGGGGSGRERERERG